MFSTHSILKTSCNVNPSIAMAAVFEAARWKVLKSLVVSPVGLFINVLGLAILCVSAERSLKSYSDGSERRPFANVGIIRAVYTFMWQSDQKTGYHHVWPEMKFGWRIVVGTIVGFFGAAFGSVGGVGGGGIFVPMLSLIIGFDPKSATALSKCMITGGAASTVYYNLNLRHPTLDMPIIDYDLALLIQPMLMLGISIGVTFNVIFADWMVTSLLIVLFIVISTNAFFKGVETWKKETALKMETGRTSLETNSTTHKNIEDETDHHPLPSDPPDQIPTKKHEVTLLENVYWMELGLIVFVWVTVLVLQIAKNHTATCSVLYWVFNLLQIPVSVSVSLYQAIGLYKGRRVISSRGDEGSPLQVHQLALYCVCGLVAGVVGGLLGLGGGFIMVPLFLEIGVPPQVSSATASFAMAFSSSMSVVEYYLLKRFPVPYAMYLVSVATVAALVGQHIVRRVINFLGRASLIIFVLALMIFASAIFLGGVGISHMVKRMEHHKYMGFENLCNYG